MFISEDKFKEMINQKIGYCSDCGEEISDVDPNTVNGECPLCGEKEVFGAKMAVACGALELE